VQFASHTNRIDFCQTYYSLSQEEAVNFGVKEEDSNQMQAEQLGLSLQRLEFDSA